jgi:hypothetical protein
MPLFLKRGDFMGVLNEAKAFRDINLGLKVDKAAAALPQTAAAAIFTVAGGRVAITQIVGEVTTIVQNQANNTKLIANPTVGTDVDICADLNIAADEVGCLYGISGLNSDALIGVNAGALPAQSRKIIVPSGTIDLNCSASNTGAIKWTVFYFPIDDGATVTAA